MPAPSDFTRCQIPAVEIIYLPPPKQLRPIADQVGHLGCRMAEQTTTSHAGLADQARSVTDHSLTALADAADSFLDDRNSGQSRNRRLLALAVGTRTRCRDQIQTVANIAQR